MIQINWKKVDDRATIPAYSREGDGCFDLTCVEGGVVPAKGSAIVSTGLSMEMIDIDDCFDVVKENFVLRVYPRSGLGFKFDIFIHIGTIDANYRGEIKIKLFNFGDTDYNFNTGDRLAQCCVEEVPAVIHKEVKELSGSNRGENGFGSSGK